MHIFLALSALLSLAWAAVRTTAPAGALVVGGGGKFATVQAAVNALSSSSTSAQFIFINPGTYREQVYIPALKSALTIYGYTTDTTTYASNQVTITQGKSQDDSSNNDLTATLRAWTPNFKLYNINLVNTRGKGSQALALSASATQQGYYGCQFKGFQDTILSQTGNQVFAKSYIEGATDFIFGQHASTWFDSCDIRVLAASLGYITASGRSSSSDANYYVINKSSIAAASGNSVAKGAYYLGRPWGNYARVVFQKTVMSNVINTQGWRVWNTGDERIDHVTFGEYGNTGEGASGTRASFASKLGSAVSISTILGSGYTSWVDTSYLAA